MKNIVFEGNTGSGKTTIIQEIEKYYHNIGIKVGITNDMDNNSPYYSILKSMYDNSSNMSLQCNFTTSLSETFLQLADLTYSIERIKSENNDINLFDRYIFSVLAYQEVLIQKDYSDIGNLMQHLEQCCHDIILPIDAIFYFKLNFQKCIERTEMRDNKKITEEEQIIFQEFDDNLEKVTFTYAKKHKIPIYIINDEDLNKNKQTILAVLKGMEK